MHLLLQEVPGQEQGEVVLEGQREVLGMPNFSDLLSENDVDQLYQYLLYRAQQSVSADQEELEKN